MLLFIDQTNFNQITFAVLDKKLVKKVYKIHPQKSSETLGKLEAFLKTAKVKLPSVTKIIVNKGPGSYTGTRVGVTHALALGFALSVPVTPMTNEKFLISINKLSK